MCKFCMPFSIWCAQVGTPHLFNSYISFLYLLSRTSHSLFYSVSLTLSSLFDSIALLLLLGCFYVSLFFFSLRLTLNPLSIIQYFCCASTCFHLFILLSIWWSSVLSADSSVTPFFCSSTAARFFCFCSSTASRFFCFCS